MLVCGSSYNKFLESTLEVFSSLFNQDYYTMTLPLLPELLQFCNTSPEKFFSDANTQCSTMFSQKCSHTRHGFFCQLELALFVKFL